MTTGVSAAAAMLSWMLCDVIKNKKPTLIGASTGMVAGLVGITPGAGFVPMWAAVIIGLTTSPVCYIMISYGKKKFGFDDALDAFSCHGTGGIWGGLLTGVFSCTAINSSAGNGLVYGEFAQFGAQAAGIGITIVIAVAEHSSATASQDFLQAKSGLTSEMSLWDLMFHSTVNLLIRHLTVLTTNGGFKVWKTITIFSL